MAINTSWHEKHRMPQNPSLTQRINWHIAHAKHCACRPMPQSVISALESKNLKTCSRGHKYLKSPCPICYPGQVKK